MHKYKPIKLKQKTTNPKLKSRKQKTTNPKHK